ncbi:bifunctional AP-4-A phosphorylase/ADP sulfurylase [Collariella sp. IMI 366227]|nr:bifunctional AP-4-A phosphorylase/ADP sulfurylase [Collariella sp. IMI 366227]
MAPVKVPVNLPELVKMAFSRARASGDVFFFETQVTLVNVNSVPVQRQQEKETLLRPFDNPAPAMLITPLASAHNLVLNKFAIVPEHFILATQAFKEQTHLLERADLEKELYVFFNSGAASGSSQPHRHIQMLPVAKMRRDDGDQDRAWDVLAGVSEEEVRGRVPFQTFAEEIKRGDEKNLYEVYLRLYRKACEAVLGSAEAQGVIVDDVMVIAPRVAEGEAVVGLTEDGERRPVGKLALNGTVLAGTALVKTQEEWDALRDDPGQLHQLLGRIGLPNIQAPSLL